MECKKCHHSNEKRAIYCSHCGAILEDKQKENVGYTDPKSNCNILSIIGLIFSLLSILVWWIPFVGTVISVVALIMCIVAYKKIKKSGENGSDLVRAGLIISIVVLPISVAVLMSTLAYMDVIIDFRDILMKLVNV